MNIAAAQYSGQHQSVDDHITHHLRFIAEAARQGCDLLVFPELSLTGSGMTMLPLPPGDAQLEPLLDAAHRYRITVIAGLPVERDGQRQKGLALFTPLVNASFATRKVAEPARCRERNSSALLMRMPIPQSRSQSVAVYQLSVSGG